MGCGCSKKLNVRVKKGVRYVYPRGELAHFTIPGVCAGCRSCEWREGRPVVCSIDGKPIREKQYGGACPLDKFPKRWDRVTWCGWTWIGTPWPVRLYRKWKGGKETRDKPGCGCSALGKLEWIRACRAWPRGRVRAFWLGIPMAVSGVVLRAFGKLPIRS